MPGHELDPGTGHLVGDGHRLLRVAGIVAGGEVELLAEHAAGSVDVGHGHVAAVLHLRAERGVLAGNRADDRDGGGRVPSPPPQPVRITAVKAMSSPAIRCIVTSLVDLAHNLRHPEKAQAPELASKPGRARSRGWCAHRASDIASPSAWCAWLGSRIARQRPGSRR